MEMVIRVTCIFLDDFGIFLGRKRNRFVVKKGQDRHEFLAEDVKSIICTCKGITVSASALNLAIKNNVQVVFANYDGWPYAILMPTTMTGSVRARREQFSAYKDERGFILAQGFVEGKLKNQANIVKIMAKNRKQRNPHIAKELYEAGRTIDRIHLRVKKEKGTNIDGKRQVLMNLEAEAAKIYWQAVRRILPPDLKFISRETRGAKDPFNAMLNFGYQAILFPEVWKAICYAGLDPYAGFLHADRPGKPSMVLDLMEEFRQQVIDRTLIGLFTKKSIKPKEVSASEFELESGRILNKKTIQTLVNGFFNRLETSIMFDNRKSSIRNFIFHQARMVTRYLLGNSQRYQPFILGW